MPDSLRHQIIDALKSQLEGITTGAGYRNTIDTVEIAARDWDEVKSGERPYIGIVPQTEVYKDEPGHVVVDWTIDLVVHLDSSARTGLAVMEALADITADIRKVLYSDAQLSVSGVHFVRVVQKVGTEGAPEAASQGIASAVIQILVRFSEDADG